MALSQKYDGVVLMPWFNVAEWKSVKDLIYSDNLESQQLAVDRMKLWKLRTPLVSVGIDGTLELLGVLLREKNNYTNDDLVLFYSISLLRFLNICAASNDKQGTFYKTAEKNDLPYWLITLRHDIAHGNKSPSLKFLRLAISTCLQWVKEKYWDVVQMEDYVVSDKINIKDLTRSYARLKLMNYFNENTDAIKEEIKNKVDSLISDNLSRITTDDFIILLEDHLIQTVTLNKIKDSSIHIVTILVEEDVITTIRSCSLNGVKRIPSNFVQIWHKILNLLYKNGTLFILINKLADTTESETKENSVKEIASLWIGELYQGLLKTKKMKEEYDTLKSIHSEQIDKRTAKLIFESKVDAIPQFKDAVTFSDFEILPVEDSRLFQDRILGTPNEYSMNYLEMVLKFNGCTETFRKKKIDLIKKLVQFNTTYYTDEETIYNVNDLIALKESYKPGTSTKRTDSQENVRTEGRKRFRVLTDAEKFAFKGYPLGCMPPKY